MKKKFKISEYTDTVDFREYEPLTLLEAVKANCKQCYCWDISEMKECNSYTCPLNQFLKNDFKITKNYSDEARQKMKEVAAKMREKRMNKLNNQ